MVSETIFILPGTLSKLSSSSKHFSKIYVKKIFFHFYSDHIPSFQSYIWISPKAGFWYERQERRGVLFTLKDGFQFEKNALLLKDRFYCSKAGFRFRKAGFTLRKAGFLLKGRKGGVCISL